MKRGYKKLLVILALISSVSVMTGCGGKSTGANSGKTDTLAAIKEKGVLTVASSMMHHLLL